MTFHYRTQGFVIKKTEQGENNIVFSIFTKDFGKIEIVGRAIRKINSKLRPNIDIFSLCEIEFIQGRIYKTLTDVRRVSGFLEIKNDLEKVKIAYRISDTLDKFIIGPEKDQKIFNLLKNTFSKLNNSQFFPKESRLERDPSGQTIIDYQSVYYFFLLRLLSVLGYR